MTDGSPKDRDDPPDDDFAEGLTEGGETKDGAPDVDEACDESVGDETLEEDAAGEDAAGEDDVVAADAEPGRAAPGLIVEPDGGVNSVVVQDAVPDTMFVFPLQKSVPFPSLMMPLLLDSSAARDVVAKAEANNGYLFLVLQKDPEQEDATSADELYEVGVITRIVKTLKLPDGSQSAMTQGVRRARRVKVVRERPHLFVRVQQLVEIPAQGERADSMFRLLQAQLQQLAQLQEQADSGFATALLNVEDPGQLSEPEHAVVLSRRGFEACFAAAQELDLGEYCVLVPEPPEAAFAYSSTAARSWSRGAPFARTQVLRSEFIAAACLSGAASSIPTGKVEAAHPWKVERWL